MLVECVPNFSEGRDAAVIAGLEDAVRAVPGVALLDRHSDPDHHRTVLTFVGAPEAVLEAAFAAVARAVATIDLTRHAGVHPRLGAADVVPFVPLGDGDDAVAAGRDPAALARCVALAEALATRAAAELDLPVYLYAAAARRPERRRLPWLRRPAFEGLASALATPERAPDLGPPRPHPTAGALVTGARPPLVAFNVDLATDDLRLARAIARALRESDGGLPGVQARGMALASQGRAQVSTNLLDAGRVGPGRVLVEVRRRAAEAGVAVARTELVGLIPRAALREASEALLGLAGETEQSRATPASGAPADGGATPDEATPDGGATGDEATSGPSPGLGPEPGPLRGRVLEDRVTAAAADPGGALRRTLDALASTAPDAPGGGSAAALGLALGAACLHKALGLARGGRSRAPAGSAAADGPPADGPLDDAALDALAARVPAADALVALAQEDHLAFARFLAARRLPRDAPGRAAAVARAREAATAAPARLLAAARAVAEVAAEVALRGNPHLRGDALAAAEQALAAARVARANALANLPPGRTDPGPAFDLAAVEAAAARARAAALPPG